MELFTRIIAKSKDIFYNLGAGDSIMVKPFGMQRAKSAVSGNTSIISGGSTIFGLGVRARARIWDSFKMGIVAFPPIAAVIFLSVMLMNQASSALSTTNNLNTYLSLAIQLHQLASVLQKERGISCAYMTRVDDAKINNLERQIVGKQLISYQNLTDLTLESIGDEPWAEVLSNNSALANSTALKMALQDFRDSMDSATGIDAITFFTPLIEALIYNSGRVFFETKEGGFWGAFNALRLIQYAGEAFGTKRAFGGTFIAQGFLSEEHLLTYILVIDEMNEKILKNESFGSDLDRARFAIFWFNNITLFMDSVVNPAREFLNQKMSLKLNGQSTDSYTVLWTTISTILASLLICAPIIAYLSVQTNRMHKKIREKMQELHMEKTRSELLLYSMLPKSIAKSLKLGHLVLPKTYNEATVYFSDIKGFTNISSTSTPLEIVQLLNDLYITMDNVLDGYNCYKVETIGDAYMVVSGIPKICGYDHSSEICTMALHMLREVSNMVIPHRPSQQLKLRIGVNSGTCAAGIVGLKMPRYCLFGDTVNTASRMESTGIEMRIQLSENTTDHLKRHFKGQFEFVERGMMEIKGKGLMCTYWLLGKQGFNFRVDA
ncbi:unnamed protein product, partial [Mesorhabditis spiculigera]